MELTLTEECALRKRAREEGWLHRLDNIKCKRKTSNRAMFLKSKEWKETRQKILEFYGKKCMACGSIEKIQVDHIKPRSKYPELELDVTNLQVLCWECNKIKNNKHETDYRKSYIEII